MIESMEEAFKKIIPEVPFVAEIRVAEDWRVDMGVEKVLRG